MQFSNLIDEAVLPNVAAARLEHNKSAQPPEGSAPGAPAPTFDTNEAFLKFRQDEDIRSMVKKHGLLPPQAPADPVWWRVTRKQGLKALARATQVGLPAPIYEADIAAVIEAMPETTASEILAKNDMRIEFREAPTWVRGNQFFETMVGAMEITPEQRDALLQLAATFQE